MPVFECFVGKWGRVARAAAVSCFVVWPGIAGAFDVELSGTIDEELRERLLGGSLLFEQSNAESPASVQEIVSTAQADYQRLLAVLYDSGYFGAVIRITLDGREAASIPSVTPPRAINKAVITIEPGSVFRFGRAVIAPTAPKTVLPEGFAAGETASLSTLRDAVSAGVTGWQAQGYAKAQLARQTVTARHADSTINAELQLAPGPRLTFGSLVVSGNENVRTKRIIEIAGLPTGSVYSPKELDEAAARLRRTGAFRSAALIEAEDPNGDNSLDINARITEAKPRRFGFGAELSTLEGLTLSTFWMHRNLLGGAERLRVEGEIGGIGGETGGTDFRFSTRFERPATFNEDVDFYALAEIEDLDEVGFSSRQISLEAGLERIASENRTYRLGVGFRRAKTSDAFGENDYTLLLLPAGATFDYRDKALDARRGYYADVSVTPFVAVSGADNGVLSTLDLRAYKTFGEARPVTFALRGQLGSLIGPALNVAPADFLFYSGGGGTVRGHDFQSLGVDLGGGNEVGGRAFAGLSAEARFRTSGNLGYVAFFDVGYVGEETFPDGSGEFQSGAGVGLRYDTSIGPIRFDVAVPTSGDDDGTALQFYIGIGHSF